MEKDLPRTPAYPVPHSVFTGLQRDVRDEKEWDTYKTVCPKECSPPSTSPTFSDRRPPVRTMTSSTWNSDGLRSAPTWKEEARSGRERKQPRVCGLRRVVFYSLLAFAMLLVIGLVVGLTVGLRDGRDPETADPATSITSSPPPTPPSVLPGSSPSPGDPMNGTSIASLSFTPKAAIATSNQQSFRLYYQEVDNAIQEIRYDSPVPGWQNSTPILTDARKNTGLAAFTYLNGTEQDNFLVYIDNSNVIQGKRLIASDPVWEYSMPLHKGNFQVNGSAANPDDNGSLRLAAAYSTDFSTGPGARVFYHAKPQDGSPDSWVQELIWDQQSDSWSAGAKITDPVPNSQLTATIDGKFLRLFYCSGNGTLQESYLNMTDSRAKYTKGVTKEHVLPRDDAAISALNVAGSTLVYFLYQRAGIRELNITGVADSSQQAITLNPSTIATADSQAVLSIGSIAGASPDGSQKVHVFHSALPGSETEGASVSAIVDSQRNVSDSSWPSNLLADPKMRLPLGPASRG